MNSLYGHIARYPAQDFYFSSWKAGCCTFLRITSEGEPTISGSGAITTAVSLFGESSLVRKCCIQLRRALLARLDHAWCNCGTCLFHWTHCYWLVVGPDIAASCLLQLKQLFHLDEREQLHRIQAHCSGLACSPSAGMRGNLTTSPLC